MVILICITCLITLSLLYLAEFAAENAILLLSVVLFVRGVRVINGKLSFRSSLLLGSRRFMNSIRAEVIKIQCNPNLKT